MDPRSGRKVPRSPKCARCRNHGFVVAVKGHARRCRFSQCDCWKCTRTTAKQRGGRRGLREELGVGDPVPGVGIGVCDPVPGVGQRAQKDTGIDLEAEEITEGGAPEVQTSTDHRTEPRDRTREPLWWEHFVTQIPPNTVPSGDLPMATPFYLHPYYPGAYPPPPVLLSFRAPPPRPLGFPQVPQVVLMDNRQEGPGFFYMPYHLHPRPEYYQHHLRVDSASDGSPLQHERDSGPSQSDIT